MEKSVESKTINGIKVIQPESLVFAEEKPCSEDTRLKRSSALYLFKKRGKGTRRKGAKSRKDRENLKSQAIGENFRNVYHTLRCLFLECPFD